MTGAARAEGVPGHLSLVPARLLRELGRAVTWHRRLLAAGLLAGSLALALTALAPPAAPTVGVLAATRDLAGGTTLSARDVHMVDVPPGTEPAGRATAAAGLVGRVLAAPVRRGEAITDVRVVGPGLLTSYGDDLVAAPVRIADAAAAGLLRPGDVVDILAASAASAASTATGASEHPGDPVAARLVAAAVRVLTVPEPSRSGFGGTGSGEGALVVLATTDETAARLASAAASSRLSVTIRPA